jgi:ribosomal protein S18 acetylase RimI-like enzyme
MGLSLRQVARTDRDEIAAVHVNAWLVGYRGIVSDELLDGLTVEQATATWSDWLGAAELPPVTVAVRDGVLVGFCWVATPSRDEDADERVAEVTVLNVRPDAWRSGVGTALMHDALDRFRSDGWRAVTLWLADGNQRAQSFYEHLGFELDGGAGLHDGTGARKVRMRLELTDPAGA